MKCPICNEEVRDTEQAQRWGPEFAHSTCVTAYNYGMSDARAALAAQPGSVGEPVASVRVEGGMMRGATRRPGMASLPDGDHKLYAAAPTEAKPAQPCGHPESLLLKSAETGEPLYCEACDDKSGRRDAEQRETELLAANQALREKIAALSKPAQDAVDAGMYRKKPVVIEAFQMTRERRQDNKEWPQWLNRAWNMTWPEPGAVSCEDFPTSDGTDRLVIATLEGVHTVSFGDWIIKGVKGEIYPCKPDIFEATYERAAISAKEQP